MTRLDIVEHGQGRRRRLSVVVAAGVLALFLFVLLSGRGDPAPPPAPTAEPTGPRVVILDPTPAAANAVFPKEKGSGKRRTIDVTFPDGARARLGYPADLRLAELGVRPRIGVTLVTDDGSVQPRMLVAPYRGEAEVARNGPMIRHLTDNVTLWPRPEGAPAAGEVLLFAFGPWRLALTDMSYGLTFEQRRTLARNLRGRVTKDGFLVLSARRPLALARPGEVYAEVPYGPQLWLGGDRDRLIVLIPTPDCPSRAADPPAIRSVTNATGAGCRGDVYLAAAGDQEFVDRVLNEVRVRYEARSATG